MFWTWPKSDFGTVKLLDFGLSPENIIFQLVRIFFNFQKMARLHWIDLNFNHILLLVYYAIRTYTRHLSKICSQNFFKSSYVHNVLIRIISNSGGSYFCHLFITNGTYLLPYLSLLVFFLFFVNQRQKSNESKLGLLSKNLNRIYE